MAESTQTLRRSRVQPVPMCWSPAQGFLGRRTQTWQSKSYVVYEVDPCNMKRAGIPILGVWVAVVMIVVFGDRMVQAQIGTGFANEAARQVIVTERALRHIEERHWPNSPAKGAGKFLQDYGGLAQRARQRSRCQWAGATEHERATRSNLRVRFRSANRYHDRWRTGQQSPGRCKPA